MKKIFIYGASGHGLVIADIAKSCGYEKIIYVDDGANPYPSFEEIGNNSEIPIALGIGSNTVRKKLFEKIKKAGFTVATLIHPSAIVSDNVKIGVGSVVMPGVVINTHSIVGKGAIINTASVIEHENTIGDFAHISPGAALAGNVTIGDLTHIGIGSSIIQGATVGSGCLIGAGSVVIHSIENNTLCYGNPCKVIKELH